MLKLLYLGFDGLDPEILLKHRGCAARLRDFAVLRSFSPVPITGPAWTSLNTGLKVETHGLNEPWGRVKEGSKTFAELPDFFFWNYLNRAGFKCGVMNVPITWPPKVIDGWMVSGPFVPNRKNICSPPDLFDPVKANYYPDMLNEFFEDQYLCRQWFGRNHFDPLADEPENMSDYNSPGMLKDIGWKVARDMAAAQSDNRRWGMEMLTLKRPVDCIFYQDSFLDRINHAHAYRPCSYESEALYDDVEAHIVWYMKRFPAETTIIVSDHGGHSGHHEDHGVFAIKSPSATPLKTESCNIYDVLPTTLHAMGITPPSVDGRIAKIGTDDA